MPNQRARVLIRAIPVAARTQPVVVASLNGINTTTWSELGRTVTVTLRAFKDYSFAAVAIYLWQGVIFRMALALGGGQGTHPCTSR
jgi:hypothetical protein